MTGWLLDTNVLSEIRKKKPHRRVVAFVAEQPMQLLYISAVTLVEIRFGIALVTNPSQRTELNAWLTHKVRPLFERRVLEVSEDVLFTWRVLVEEGRKTGHTYSQPDLFIAATALRHGLTIVSRDTSEYRRAGAAVVNPWGS